MNRDILHRSIIVFLGVCAFAVVFTILFEFMAEPCKSFESECFDFTPGTWDTSIELDKSICRDHNLCIKYCNETYGTEAEFSTCCWTFGESPDINGHCYNMQACKCFKNEDNYDS